MSRLSATFAALKATNKKALVTYIAAGDPDLETSAAILHGLPAAGADIIELSVPFSDPMADGPTIQQANIRAFKAGITLKKVLAMVATFRATNTTTPIVLMGYYNPIFVYGVAAFLRDAKAAGVDGLIIVDLPPEEDAELCTPAQVAGIDFIRLITPTTDDKRLPTVLHSASGFLYYVSITGITGTRGAATTDVHAAIARIREQSTLPTVIGFGINTPDQARAMAEGADGVVVGSAIVHEIVRNLTPEGKATSALVSNTLAFVQSLAMAVHSQ